MSDEANEVSLSEILAEVDDPQLREVISKSANARMAIYKAMEYVLDSTAMSSAKRLMTSPDVPDTIKRDMILGWLSHRRNDRELAHRMTGSQQGNAISFTFNMNAQEGNNVERARKAFGIVDEVEDAAISHDK